MKELKYNSKKYDYNSAISDEAIINFCKACKHEAAPRGNWRNYGSNEQYQARLDSFAAAKAARRDSQSDFQEEASICQSLQFFDLEQAVEYEGITNEGFCAVLNLTSIKCRNTNISLGTTAITQKLGKLNK